MKILVINPGSTTTKLAVYDDQNLIFEYKIDHAQDPEFQSKYTSAKNNVFDQFEYRLDLILDVLKKYNIDKLDGIVGRGGMMPPVVSGTYQVNEKMIDDLRNRPLANHASNLGAALAFELCKKYQLKDSAFIVDPVTTDELENKHKITGIPGVNRFAAWHALNQKAVSREYANSIGKSYQDLNLIVAHLGGGFSFGAHRKGKVINVYNALAGEGPFSPERAGAIPAQNLVELCFSGKYNKEEIMHLIAGGGGLYAHLGTKNLIELENNYETLPQDQKDIVDAMIAGISRSIASLIPDFEGEKVDQIILTGGVVRWKSLVEKIQHNLSTLNTGISLYPGEKELESLRDGALRVLKQEETAKTYN